MTGDWLRGLVVAKNPPGRWWYAARGALCLSGPVALGWAVGDMAAGLVATIGGFTALYGADRPYASRAGHLAVIAMGFAAAVTLGDWAAGIPWLGVLAVSVIAVIATLLCNALTVGPPGAYMFVLSCAAGTAASVAHVSPWRMGLLVLCGGAFAWAVSMAGAVRGWRRPEKAVVAASARAVVGYLRAFGTDRENEARHAAAYALHRSWVTLVNFQPTSVGAGPTLCHLRAVNRELHVLFAEAMGAAAAGRPADPQWTVRAEGLAAGDEQPARDDRTPLGGPSPVRLVQQALQPRAGQLLVVVRVGIAVPVAGSVAALLGVDRSYWAMAAAVLVLHQGFDRRRTVRRGIERSVGTWVGLLLAGVLLAIDPQGLWLAAVLAVLVFAIEMLVVPTYAIAVVFITPTALLIASGARPVGDIAGLLVERGLDTLIGTVVAVLVYVVVTRGHDVVNLAEAVAATLEAVAAVTLHLARGAVTIPAALAARRDLQLRAFRLQPSYATAMAGSRRRRDAAERLWPAIAAAENLAYRTLAACWAREKRPEESAWPPGELERFQTVTAELARAVRSGSPPRGVESLPDHGNSELAALRDSLGASVTG